MRSITIIVGMALSVTACDGGDANTPTDPSNPKAHSWTQPASPSVTERFGVLEYRIEERGDEVAITSVGASGQPLASMEGRRDEAATYVVLRSDDGEIHLEFAPGAGDGAEIDFKVDGVPLEAAALDPAWPTKEAAIELWSAAGNDLAEYTAISYQHECWPISSCTTVGISCGAATLCCIGGLNPGCCASAAACWVGYDQNCVDCINRGHCDNSCPTCGIYNGCGNWCGNCPPSCENDCGGAGCCCGDHCCD